MVTGEKAAARHAAEESESCCPVCLTTAEGGPECANCRWTLEGPAVLGPLTPEIRHAFDDRLAGARRRLDLTAAARAAGYPGRGEPERLTRLEALLRGGPPRSTERDQMLAELAELAEAADELTVTDLPELLPDGVVIEIGPRGLRAVAVRDGAEQAEATEWPWAELLPGLPDSADETLFCLAGGVGDRTTRASEAREPATLPATVDVLASRLRGWTVPERLLARLIRRFPQARTLYLPPERPEPGPLRHAGGFTAAVCRGAPDSDDVLLVGGGQDGSVTVWKLWQCSPLASRKLHDRRVTCADLTEDGLSVVSGGQDGAVRLWSFAASGRARVLAWHDGWVNALRRRGGVVFSLGDDACVQRTVLGAAGAVGAVLARVGWASATALEVTGDGRVVIVAGADGASLWDGRSGARTGRLTAAHEVACLALDRTDRLVALGCADGVARICTLGAARTAEAEMDGHTGPVRQVAFGPGGVLATADDTGTVRVRERDGTARTVGTHPDRVRGLAFTPDGRLLSAGADGLVRTWPLAGTHRTDSDKGVP
ncbi:WD40 repeat domain-containing protein [Streptomyces paromomycinus]|uniref:Uncharacterized protein n=1 Tax=Streptomyces paromomycinus TaxID=92743 RepID=A0A401VU51_STREY|nr:hypothetical protein [Streptomyces paromomycinus]GCD40596.1 hypothetical protein GKJPGBOP_00249 [Streptomyces paromomycinus]